MSAEPYAGYVYLMRRDDGACKIGRSGDPELRRREIAARTRAEVTLVLTVAAEDAPALETALHRLFDEKRIEGEWFALEDSDIGRFRRFTRSYRPPPRRELPHLPNFIEAMRANPALLEPLPFMRVHRYARGIFPDAVYWLLLGPELLEALARDARKLSAADRERLREIVYTVKPRGGRPAKPPAKGKK